MILHSIVPYSTLFPDEGRQAFEYRKSGNGIVCGVSQGNKFIVERLISTNPHDYLNKDIFPGSEM